MVINWSLSPVDRFRDRFRNGSIGLMDTARSWLDHGSQAEELGADVKLFQPGGLQINLEMDGPILELEIDCSSLAGEARKFAYRQHAGSLHRGKYGRDALLLRRADENDMAPTGILRIGDGAHQESPAAELLTCDGLLQSAAERVATENADRDWLCGTAEGALGPAHKFGEVVERGRLHLVFVDLSPRACRPEDPQEGSLATPRRQQR